MTDTTLIKALRDRMHECAEAAFYAAERFGLRSRQHELALVIYTDTANRYASECNRIGREPYATYSED